MPDAFQPMARAPSKAGDVPRELLQYVWLAFWAVVVGFFVIAGLFVIIVLYEDVEAKVLEHSNGVYFLTGVNPT